jgi:hypothetical protein
MESNCRSLGLRARGGSKGRQQDAAIDAAPPIPYDQAHTTAISGHVLDRKSYVLHRKFCPEKGPPHVLDRKFRPAGVCFIVNLRSPEPDPGL